MFILNMWIIVNILCCNMALRGVKVIELAGVVLGPTCGLFLSDFGASVIRVDKVVPTKVVDVLGNGKQSIALNLEHKKGIDIFLRLCKTSDVLIDTYRPGLMEALGIGPNVLLSENPKLIYAQLSGYGQNGIYSKRAGYDINYLALTGILSMISTKNLQIPQSLLASLGGGGLMCAIGIVTALIERVHSGKGQVIDANVIEGIAYLGSWIYRSQNIPYWREHKSNINNFPFYGFYETKDGKFMTAASFEPKFYYILLKALGLSKSDYPQFRNGEKVQNIFIEKFLEKTQAEWCEIFENIDACVSPVLDFKQVPKHPHNAERKTFIEQECLIPEAAPKLSRTPAESHATKPKIEVGQHTEIILRNLGYTENDINQFEIDGIIARVRNAKM